MARLVRLAQIAEIRPGMGLSGRSAGAREGDWKLDVLTVGSIQDDRLDLSAVETIGVEQNSRTIQHLLQPDDVLVSARSTIVKAALVPPTVSSRTVADATLLVVRAATPGLGHYLWLYFTSGVGRRRILAQAGASTTLFFISAANLGELELPVPEHWELGRIADFVDASERAYLAATESAALRRVTFRDLIVERLGDAASTEGETSWP